MVLRRWLFLFLREDGPENRLLFLQKFLFFLNTGAVLLEVSERVFLSGVYYGLMDESSVISNSPIAKVEKVDRIKISTLDNHVYYLNEKNKHPLMVNLFRDVMSGQMSELADCYLPLAFSREKYL